MEVVKMIASVAGEEVFVGECHPARARVLVKKELASWKDGKILLHVLNVHDKMLSNNPDAARGPLDDENVSKQEMERRLAWFRSFLTKATKVLAKMARPLPTLDEAMAWDAGQKKMEDELWQAGGHAYTHSIDSTTPFCWRSANTKFVVTRTPEPEFVLTDDEVEAYFDKEAKERLKELHDVLQGSQEPAWKAEWKAEREALAIEADEFLAAHGLDSIWESEPEVHRVFNVPGLPVVPPITKAEYERVRERDRMFFRKERLRRDYVENPPVEVAHIVQVRYLRTLAE